MYRLFFTFAVVVAATGVGFGQSLDPNVWPPDTDFSQEVHYWSSDNFMFDALPDDNNFLDTLSVLSGGDQETTDVEIGGTTAKKSGNLYINVADEFFDVWPAVPVVDVLIQYFANSASPRDNLNFLLGHLPNSLLGVGNYQGEPYTLVSTTDEWEWRLFRIDNSAGLLGDTLQPSEGADTFGGVNGGTIRFQSTTDLIVRGFAMGPEGVFGDPSVINVTSTVEFNPDEFGLVAEWDPNNGITDGLDLFRVTSGDQETVESSGIGPADDQRQAARPAFGDGTDAADDVFVNWEILDEHFGPSTQPSTRIMVVAEYYDDPALVGGVFGPEAYVTAGGGFAFFPAADRTTITGTGKWMEAVWYVPDVKFSGVNVPTQAGARFHYTEPVYISRLRVGVIRSSGIYAGVNPIPDAFPFDPDPFEIYAEYNIDTDERIGLDLANNGGDQEYFIDGDVGPAGDKRTAVRPALAEGTDPFDRFLNWTVLDEHFGPSSQPNAFTKIAVDYYDDPDLVGKLFGPEVYRTNQFGTLQLKFFPAAERQVLEGTGEWKISGWVIEDLNFTGVNAGAQGIVRFAYDDDNPVYISRIRVGVIRPVGQYEGVDPLEDVVVSVTDWELF